MNTSYVDIGPAFDEDGDSITVRSQFAFGYFTLTDLVLQVNQTALLLAQSADSETTFDVAVSLADSKGGSTDCMLFFVVP